jgi:hypothetical protein
MIGGTLPWKALIYLVTPRHAVLPSRWNLQTLFGLRKFVGARAIVKWSPGAWDGGGTGLALQHGIQRLLH